MRNGNTLLHKPIQEITPLDWLRVIDLFKSVFITGSPGSGKSSTIGYHLMLAMMMAGFGMLILCCKPDEAQKVITVAKKAGRPDDDIVLFNAESGHAFDAFWYEYNRIGRGSNNAEAVIDYLNAILAFGKPPTSSSGEAQYFERACEELSRAAITLLRCARQDVSLTNIYRVASSLPTKPGEFLTPEYQANSYTAKLFADIDERGELEPNDETDDLTIALDFITNKWPSLDARTSGAILSTLTGMVSRFQYQPLRRLFADGRCTFLPEQMLQQGKIVIVDFPINTYGITSGPLAAGMVKLCFQRAILRRDTTKHPIPVAIWQDEGQLFLAPSSGSVSRENAFLQVARSAMCSTVFLTQSIANVAEALGENDIGSKTRALIGNFGNRIAFQNDDISITNQHYSTLFGKHWKHIKSSSYGTKDPSISSKPELVFRVEPDEFTQLAIPDAENPEAEAYVYCGGKKFEASKTPDCPDGRTFILTKFSR